MKLKPTIFAPVFIDPRLPNTLNGSIDRSCECYIFFHVLFRFLVFGFWFLLIYSTYQTVHSTYALYSWPIPLPLASLQDLPQMRCCPRFSTRTTLPLRRTLRCCEIAGGLALNLSPISDAGNAPHSASISTMILRAGPATSLQQAHIGNAILVP